jgi:hypothetical protein
MSCRKGCGARCIAPSIASRIPGMPHGKPAGVRCVHLDVQYLGDLYEHPERSVFCHSFAVRRPLRDFAGGCSRPSGQARRTDPTEVNLVGAISSVRDICLAGKVTAVLFLQDMIQLWRIRICLATMRNMQKSTQERRCHEQSPQ